jgi:hypothetical protein
MRCTAHTTDRKRDSTHRCERGQGHPGLHRYTFQFNSGPKLYVKEFPNSKAFFPDMSLTDHDGYETIL